MQDFRIFQDVTVVQQDAYLDFRIWHWMIDEMEVVVSLWAKNVLWDQETIDDQIKKIQCTWCYILSSHVIKENQGLLESIWQARELVSSWYTRLDRQSSWAGKQLFWCPHLLFHSPGLPLSTNSHFLHLRKIESHFLTFNRKMSEQLLFTECWSGITIKSELCANWESVCYCKLGTTMGRTSHWLQWDGIIHTALTEREWSDVQFKPNLI